MTHDTVDRIAGLGSALIALRERRPQTRQQLQASFDALFTPFSAEHVSQQERELIAAFTTRIGGADRTSAFYAERALSIDPTRARLVVDAATQAATSGPFGAYAERGLQGENSDGVRWEPGPDVVATLGERLAAALAHAHLLVFRPREAAASDLGRLAQAGWSSDGIVTLSQLISFLTFQQRVVIGLRALEAAGSAGSASPVSAEEHDDGEEAA